MPIEATAGAAKEQLKLYVRHIRPDGTFTTNSFPSDGDVDNALATAESEILVWLASAGYDTDSYIADPTNWPITVRSYLSGWNALGAAYRIEFAHQSASFSATPSTRGETYYQLYTNWRDLILEGKIDLTDIGIPASSVNRPQGSYTGESKEAKKVLTSDPDRVKPFFSRDGFKNPTITPTEESIP